MQDQGKILKAYIARVLGHFPSEAVTVDKHLAWDSRRNHAFVVDSNGRLAEKQSLGAVPLPSQLQQLQAKEAQTSFRLLSVAADGKTSLVECLPKTGRTHQIRWWFWSCLVVPERCAMPVVPYLLLWTADMACTCTHLRSACDANVASFEPLFVGSWTSLRSCGWV